MTEQPIQAQVRAKIAWREEDVNRLPVLAANQFAVPLSNEPDDPVPSVLLTVGNVTPPLLLGTPEEQQAAAAAVESVNVQPLARFSLPPRRPPSSRGSFRAFCSR